MIRVQEQYRVVSKIQSTSFWIMLKTYQKILSESIHNFELYWIQMDG